MLLNPATGYTSAIPVPGKEAAIEVLRATLTALATGSASDE